MEEESVRSSINGTRKQHSNNVASEELSVRDDLQENDGGDQQQHFFGGAKDFKPTADYP